MHYETLVVGGGPAGSSAAFHLSNNGIRVLVLEKEVLPREKVCGDGISPRGVRHLYEMGLRDRIDGSFQKIRGFKVQGISKWVIENPVPTVRGFPDHGYTMRRTDLDKMLLDHARESGAEVWEKCTVSAPILKDGRVCGVRATRNGEEVEILADVIIGADGAHSKLGRSMDLLVNDPRFLGIALRQYFENVDEDRHTTLLSREKVLGSCMGWVFPISDSVSNIGIGTALCVIQHGKINMNRTFEAFINDSVYLAPHLRNAKPISSVRGGLLRFGLGASKVECPGMILVGDAASVTNPLTGEGISYALETGQMAAEHLLDSRETGSRLQHDPAVNPFKPKLQRRYGRSFKIGSFLMRHGFNMSVAQPIESVGHYIVSKNQPLRQIAVKLMMDFSD